MLRAKTDGFCGICKKCGAMSVIDATMLKAMNQKKTVWSYKCMACNATCWVTRAYLPQRLQEELGV